MWCEPGAARRRVCWTSRLVFVEAEMTVLFAWDMPVVAGVILWTALAVGAARLPGRVGGMPAVGDPAAISLMASR